jgi:hypothetical protein
MAAVHRVRDAPAGLSPSWGDPPAPRHIDDEAMTSPMEDFLTELGRREHEPLLAAAAGTIRFDVHRGGRTEYRLVRVDRGKVTVTKRKGKAGAVVDADGELLDRIADGQVNAMAAFLRGALRVQGDPELLIQLQRMFPGPPDTSSVRPRSARRAAQAAALPRSAPRAAQAPTR